MRPAARDVHRTLWRDGNMNYALANECSHGHSGSPPAEAIAEAAQASLRRSSYGALAAVSCQCESGVLCLRGRVATYYLKQLAQESVRRVHGVVQIVNDIDARPTSRHRYELRLA